MGTHWVLIYSKVVVLLFKDIFEKTCVMVMLVTIVVLVVVIVVMVVVWCLSDMWCVLQLGQEGTLGICDLLARKQAEERRYFGDKRFNRFKEAITSFRVFSRVSPAETWALYLLGA